MPKQAHTTPTTIEGGDRALGLVLARESDENDDDLFDGMREQTYLQLRHIAAVEAIRVLGMEPLAGHGDITVKETLPDGSVRSKTVFIEHLRHGRTRAILFTYGGYWHLWSQSSAARVTSQGTNEFTEILMAVVRRIRPVHLYAANISRLIRSQRQAALLQTAMFDNVDTITAGSVEFRLSGEHAQVGIVLFTALAMAAAMERDWIVQRMTAGRIAKWRRGEWPFGSATVPVGYRFNPATQRLEVIDEMRSVVREMLAVLCTDAPPSEMRNQLARAGVLTMRKHKNYGRHVPVDVLSDSGQLKNRLFAWAGVWVQGEFLFRLGNSFPHVETVNGIQVMRFDGDGGDIGELQMLGKVPVPEGGWAEPELLQAFERRAIAHNRHLLLTGRTLLRPLSSMVRNTSSNPDLHANLLNPHRAAGNDMTSTSQRDAARARRTIAPLTGRRWAADGWEYELQVIQAKRYRLFRWPLSRSRGTLRPAAYPSALVERPDAPR